jgi:oligopeptidase B
LSNIRNGTEYDLFACPKKHVSAFQWTCIHSSGKEDILEDFTINYLGCALLKRANGIPYVEFLALNSSVETSCEDLVTQTHRMPMPNWQVTSIHFGPNEDYLDSTIEFYLSSPITPSIKAAWDLSSKKLIVGSNSEWARVKTSLEKFNIDRIYCPIDANIGIPITLVSNRTKNAQMRPCLILSYGAYGEMLDLEYQSWLIPLLEREWNIAFIHIRGGGELGKGWHNEGSGIHKQNSSADLKHAIEYLIHKGMCIICMLILNTNAKIDFDWHDEHDNRDYRICY